MIANLMVILVTKGNVARTHTNDKATAVSGIWFLHLGGQLLAASLFGLRFARGLFAIYDSCKAGTQHTCKYAVLTSHPRMCAVSCGGLSKAAKGLCSTPPAPRNGTA